MLKKHKTRIFVMVFTIFMAFVIGIPSFLLARGIDQLIVEGDRSFLKGDFKAAEQLFSRGVQLEPDNYRVLKSLAETLMKLGRFEEAEPHIDRIMDMPVSNGRDVLVTLQGEAEPLTAELVDENVVTPESGQNNMRNYVDVDRNAAIPHYRFFFKKTGEMKLVPKYRVTFKYTGVRLSDYEMVKVMKAQVQKKLIAKAGGGAGAIVPVAAGCFQMGSNKGHIDEQPVHEVCLSAFMMDKYEVTQKTFQAKMNSNPSQFIGADHPVDSVTWYEADQYCRMVGKRLPTEAEWEYAARAGTSTPFYWGDKPDPKFANFCDRECDLNARFVSVSDRYKFTAPVGSFQPNAWGLHDMAGNVSEWTGDFMQEAYYRESPKDNPKGSERQKVRKVFRGGAWNMGPDEMRMANRKSMIPNYRPPSMGFRCVKSQSRKKGDRQITPKIKSFPYFP